MGSYIATVKNFANSDGRVRRKDFWLFWLVHYGICYLTLFLGELIQDDHALIAVYLSLSFIPALTSIVRRLHDTNRSGWSMLVVLIPFVGVLIGLMLLVEQGSPGDNDYGPDPKGVIDLTHPV
ncbi:DUF805 domain-containing protein [Photobacterium sp. GJ3]|uniref:DUF805 domain-containing protein n=1 Tax=Photobacterium sp. GJ3 TaxID=2829502 RepID=UPI001B8AD140|nr:DUF805 domain-containing protein [Photobacterium sp. GJ3]QUJ66184.1 DUF805 domain-containing protein [Photobacterium sp. GJ3]